MHIRSGKDGRSAKLTLTELRQLAVAQRICTDLAECVDDEDATEAAPLIGRVITTYSTDEKSTAR